MDNLFDSNNTIVSWADEACREPKKRRRRGGGRISIQEVSDIHKFTARLPITETITKTNQKNFEEENPVKNVWKESPGRLKGVISGKKVPMGSIIQVFQDTPSGSTDSSPKEEEKSIKPKAIPDFWKKKESLQKVNNVKYRNFNVRQANILVMEHLNSKTPKSESSNKLIEVQEIQKKYKDKCMNTDKYTAYGINHGTQCDKIVESIPIIDDYVWVEKFDYDTSSYMKNYIILLGLSTVSFVVGGLTVWFM